MHTFHSGNSDGQLALKKYCLMDLFDKQGNGNEKSVICCFGDYYLAAFFHFPLPFLFFWQSPDFYFTANDVTNSIRTVCSSSRSSNIEVVVVVVVVNIAVV